MQCICHGCGSGNYNCRRVEHLARNYKNRGIGNRIGKRRRLEYGQNNGQRLMIEERNGQSNLNGEEDIIVFNYVSIVIGLQCSLEQ